MADWFAMSSRYYKDLDDMGVSEAAQTCLTRMLGYIVEGEQLDGYIAKTALKKLGMRAVSRRVDELIRFAIVTPSEDELGYYVRTFAKWQAPLIAHVRKRNKDRDYQRQRYQEREDSRTRIGRFSDPHSNNTKQKRTPHSERASHVSTAGDETAAPDERPTGPAIKPDAVKLIREEIPAEHPNAVKTALRLKASEMLVGGTEPETVRLALRAWLAKPGIGPNVLPSLVSDVLKSQQPRTAAPFSVARSTTDDRIAAAQALKNHPDNVHHLRGIEA